MRIGTENCPRRVGSDDHEPPAICEEGVGIKDIRAHLRKVENYQGRGSSERALFQQTFDNRFVKVTMAPMSVCE